MLLQNELEDVTGYTLLTSPPDGFTPPPLLPPTSLTSAVSLQGPNTKRLYNDLMTGYNTMVRPVANDSENLTVKFGVTLRQIIDLVREPSKPFYWVTAVCCTSQRVWGILHTKSCSQFLFILWFEDSQSRLSVAAHGPLYLVQLVGTWAPPGLSVQDFGPPKDSATVQLL